MAKKSKDSRRNRIQMSAMEGESIDNVIIRENNIKIVEEALDRALASALEEVGLAAEGFAKKKLTENHSVDTGRLRNSVTHIIDMGEEAVYIGTNVEYAPYVELGTSHSKEKPYLRPAAQDHETEYRKIFEKHLGGTS